MKTNRNLFIIILFLFRIMAGAQPVKPSFIKGENLEYRAYFHWGFLWIYAGNVRFTAELKANPYTTTYYFVSEGNSLQKFDWLYKVRDRYEVLVDSKILFGSIRAEFTGED